MYTSLMGYTRLQSADQSSRSLPIKTELPPLRLGFSPFVNSFLLDNLRDIQLFGGDIPHVLACLESGSLDCALLSMRIDKNQWNVRQVAHSPLVICMRSDDPLSHRAQVNINEAAPRLKVFRDRELHPKAHSRLSEMFYELGISLHLANSAATPADIQMMVRQGYGLALIDQLWPLDAGLVTRPLAGLKWTADFAFVTAWNSQYLALMFIDQYLDEHDLGNNRKQPQPVPVRHSQQLKLIG